MSTYKDNFLRGSYWIYNEKAEVEITANTGMFVPAPVTDAEFKDIYGEVPEHLIDRDDVFTAVQYEDVRLPAGFVWRIWDDHDTAVYDYDIEKAYDAAQEWLAGPLDKLGVEVANLSVLLRQYIEDELLYPDVRNRLSDLQEKLRELQDDLYDPLAY